MISNIALEGLKINMAWINYNFKILKKICLLLVCLISTQVLSLEITYNRKLLPTHIKDLNLSLQDEYAYHFVMEYYESPINGMHEIYVHNIREVISAIALIDLKVIGHRKESKGTSQYLEILLESHGYYLGLHDAFGDNQDLKDKFTIMLIGSEAAGNLVGITAGVGSWMLGFGGGLIKWLGKKLSLKIYTIKMIQKITIGSLLGVGVGYGCIQILNEHKRRIILLKKNDIKIKEIEQIIIETEEDIDSINDYLDYNEVDPEQINFLTALLDDLRKQSEAFKLKREKRLSFAGK